MSKFLRENGVGEAVFNCIDRDGTMAGYDKELMAESIGAYKIPLIASGGCRHARDMKLAEEQGFTGAGAGSIFYWKGDSILSLKAELLEMGSNVREVV